jgi:hypothetical protein
MGNSIQSPWEWRKNVLLNLRGKKRGLLHCIKTRKTIIWVTYVLNTWNLMINCFLHFVHRLVSQKENRVFEARSALNTAAGWTEFFAGNIWPADLRLPPLIYANGLCCDSPWSWLCQTTSLNFNHRIASLHHVCYSEFSTKQLMLCDHSYTTATLVGCFYDVKYCVSSPLLSGNIRKVLW